MKFLLVGFCDKVALQLEQLITHELGQHIVHNVPREFVDLNPVVPQVSARETQSDICIIDLDGIGMWEYSPEHKDEILRILANRPAILISYQIHSGWQDAVKQWTMSIIDLVAQPYTIEYMTDLLLVTIRRELKRKPQQSIYTSTQLSENTPQVCSPKDNTAKKVSIYKSKEPISILTPVDIIQPVTSEKISIYVTNVIPEIYNASDIQQNKPKKSIYITQDRHNTDEDIDLTQNILEQAKVVRQLLSKHWYDFEQNELYRHLFDLFAQKDTFKIQWKHHELVVCPQRNVLLTRDLPAFWTDLQQLNEQQLQNLFLTKIPVYASYEQLEKVYLQQYYVAYPLNTFLWQFYHYLLPQQCVFNEYELKLKLKVLPKFAQMQKMPTYMQAVTAVCVEKTQNLDELQQSSRFNFFKLEHLQRVFLLSVLADYADSHLLLNTLKEKNVAVESVIETSNIEQPSVAEIKDNSLLKRLFGKR